MGNLLGKFLMMSGFEKYRRIISILLLGGSLVVSEVLCNADLLAFVPSLTDSCGSGTKLVSGAMALLGGWTGVVGIIGRKK